MNIISMKHSFTFALFLCPFFLLAQYGNLTYADFDFGSILIDFDGDGDLDVFPKTSDYPVYWAENLNGDFTYMKYNRIETLNPNYGISVDTYADFDNDGYIEVLAGDGHFLKYSPSGAQWVSIPYQSYYKGLSPQDMDADGYLDLVYISDNLSTFSWYRNLNGNGFTTNSVTTFYNVGPRDYVDYDNDGDTDIVAKFNNTVSLYLNDGTGHFGNPVQLLPNESGNMKVADFDNDGDFDLLFSTNGMLRILENQGNNVFSLTMQKQIPAATPQHILLKDYNLDGFLDILMNLSTNPYAAVYACKSNGAFSYADAENLGKISSEDENIHGLADLDSDGLPDMYFGANDGTWRKNLGGGVFSLPIKLSQTIIHKGLADLDNDGYLDNYGYNDIENYVPKFGYNKNNGGQVYKWIPLADSIIHPITVDMNGDGLVDIIAGIGTISSTNLFPKRVEVWLNDGPAQFTTKLKLQNMPSTWLSTIDVFSGDVEGDGDADIFAYINKPSGGDTKRNIALLRNNGNGQLNFQSYLSTQDITYLYDAHLYDFDGDGDPDIVLTDDDRVDWMENLGNYNFTPVKHALYNNLNFGELLALSDFDNDGLVDVIGNSYQFAYWKNLGGSFDGPYVLDAEIESPYNVSVVDFDLDGDNDFIYAKYYGSSSTGQFRGYVTENLGNGQFAPPESLQIKYPGTYQYHHEDMDGDGDMDYVLLQASVVNQKGLQWFPNLAEDRLTVRGRIFWDTNENGIWDADDYPMPSRQAQLNPDGTLIYSNREGKFLIQGASGTNYLTTTMPDTLWELTTIPDTFQIDLPKPIGSSEYLFGFKAVKDTLAGETYLMSNFLRCGELNVSQQGSIVNNGTTLMSGTLVYTPDANISVQSFDPMPTSSVNGAYFFNFENLFPGGSFDIKIIIAVPGVDFIDSTFVFQLDAYTHNPLGAQVDTFYYELNDVIKCAYDPNDKLVTPKGLGSLGLLKTAPERFTYTIRFQNTGNDAAYNVKLEDQLHPLLEWNTLRPLTASHPYSVKIDNEGLLEVKFDNINLPDSTTNFVESQGFFTYSISPQAALPAGSLITNEANIYFDNNPPVLTNKVKNFVGYELEVNIPETDTPLCLGDSITMTAEIYSNLDSVNLFWEKDGQWVSNEPSLKVNQGGQYAIIVNSYGVSVSDTVNIMEYDLPEAGFSTTITSNEIIFNNESVGANSVFWDFGNGLTSNENSPQLTLLDGHTSLQVCLTVSNPCGSDQYCQNVSLSSTKTSLSDSDIQFVTLNPNPSNGIIDLTFNVRESTHVRLSAINVQGQEFDIEKANYLQPGQHVIQIDMTSYPAGFYLFKIEAVEGILWRKVVIE